MRHLLMLFLVGALIPSFQNAVSEPFYGPLDKEVEALIGSYVYVGSGPGLSSAVIQTARSRCGTPMTGTSVPSPYAKGDFAFYRDNIGQLWVEGPRIDGRYKVTSTSDEVNDARSNFSFWFDRDGIGGRIEVELAHFHRHEGIWPGAMLMGHTRLAGVWATCSSAVDRSVSPD